MNNLTPFRTVVACVVVVVALAAATLTQAQVEPMFFTDTFDDMDIQDDSPVSWSVINPPPGATADAPSGDLVVTPQEALFVGVDNYTYDNVSIRTQVAVPPDKPWHTAAVYARGNYVDTTLYDAGITSSTHGWAPNSLYIGGLVSDWETFYDEPTDLNPAETDVVLQFDVLGDQLTLTAWAAGTPKESGQRISVRDSRLTQGLIGVAYWDTCCFVPPLDPPTPATYRFFEAAAVLPGDFNVNGVLDVEDIDLLSREVRRGRYRPQFDLNDDERVDRIDHEMWVHDLKNTWFGDADLNGEFNSSDMVQVFAGGKYEKGYVDRFGVIHNGAGWAQGDWDATGMFDSSDMVAAFADGGYEKGLKMDAAAVPEPTTILLVMAGLMGVAVCRRRLRP